MTKCSFFDDQQPPEGLPRWATTTQISAFLAVPRSTLHDTVKKAVTSGEPWVKKDIAEDGRPKYLIDTTHETYKVHEQRWKQNRNTQGEKLTPSGWYRARQQSYSHSHAKEDSTSPYISSSSFSWHQQSSANDVLRRWPIFRQRLHFWGLEVFKNILADEALANPWQWRWDDLHGEGYMSEEEAIIAAIESRLIANEAKRENQLHADTSLIRLPPETSLEQTKPQRFNLFGRRSDSNSF
jgi:hypothetical protein